MHVHVYVCACVCVCIAMHTCIKVHKCILTWLKFSSIKAVPKFCCKITFQFHSGINFHSGMIFRVDLCYTEYLKYTQCHTVNCSYLPICPTLNESEKQGISLRDEETVKQTIIL